ncbi:MAG TPA: phosphopyruvate hydratase [Chloroflexi bacterium]|jgi:enolase|nr:phosphopyruvate hydratase [Chloroflexota bacterium]
MPKGSRIESIVARQVFTWRSHPGIETTVTTVNGATGVATVHAGLSVGDYEVKFAYDGGTRWDGMGVQCAVDHVHNIIAPALKGMDATHQAEIDHALLELDGTPDRSRLGGNTIASVSAAVLKAAANSLEIPLYAHIGGVNACVLPVPGAGLMNGARRYGGGERAGDKPSYSMMCYGFDTFSEASYAAWDLEKQFKRTLGKRLGLDPEFVRFIPAGLIQHDRELWDIMTEVIVARGYEGKVGLQVDVAAGTYFDNEKGVFVGLFSAEDKTIEELVELYKWMVKEYPFVILEDPLDEDDFEGHARLTRELPIEIVGDDLFTTNPERVRKGIEMGAANAVLLKVNQVGTISEAFEMTRLAHRHGYGVMPCGSRGEGADIADYAVGLITGHLREGGTGDTANRLLQIEAELGSRAQFAGQDGLRLRR